MVAPRAWHAGAPARPKTMRRGTGENKPGGGSILLLEGTLPLLSPYWMAGTPRLMESAGVPAWDAAARRSVGASVPA